MYPKMRRKIKAECDIINLTGNTERTESSIIQLVARSSRAILDLRWQKRREVDEDPHTSSVCVEHDEDE